MTNLTREQKLKLIYRHTHKDFKGKIDKEKTILVLRKSTTLCLLNDLTDAEIEDKIGYAIHKEARRIAAKSLTSTN